jgi:hypothetical protein
MFACSSTAFSHFYLPKKDPIRLSYSWLPLEQHDEVDDIDDVDSGPQRKRMKLLENDSNSTLETESISNEADYFAKRINATWEACYE